MSVSTSTVLFAIALSQGGTPRATNVGLLAFTGMFLAALATIAHVGLVGLRRDVDIEFWSAAWTGRFGSLAFAAAKAVRGAKLAAPPMTHRATELSLGMAAEQLFESLPKASRDLLGDVPALLDRLQRGARALRQRYDELQEALSSVGGAAHADVHAELRAERDLLHDRLRDTVGALETIRLDLLRLHAGSLSLQGLTTHIGLAAEASAEVERLLEAQHEVQEALALPRVLALTPA